MTQETNDKQQVKPLIEDVKNRTGLTPKMASLDAGYYSDDNVAYLESEEIDGYFATGRQKHSDKIPAAPRGRIPKNATTKEKMARKLRTLKGRATYSKRKKIVEPVLEKSPPPRRSRLNRYIRGEKTEEIIDAMHAPFVGQRKKPRTYCQKARQDYLAVSALLVHESGCLPLSSTRKIGF